MTTDEIARALLYALYEQGTAEQFMTTVRQLANTPPQPPTPAAVSTVDWALYYLEHHKDKI